jgi:hypothetical protein
MTATGYANADLKARPSAVRQREKSGLAEGSALDILAPEPDEGAIAENQGEALWLRIRNNRYDPVARTAAGRRP